ncbi:endonuclease domain-containing protein [Streptomyces sp. NPDC056656]|uniref:endonuclease domain-containing protein n=1 Tax=Streptomyces sp. NPDC056656 TaxID=3345895 RepID=UPI0036B2C6BA
MRRPPTPLAFQGGRCAICGVTDESARTLHIDHDHTCCPGRRSCGKCDRALICASCNAYGPAWHEALPSDMRTFELLNRYIAFPPARRLREESGSGSPFT